MPDTCQNNGEQFTRQEAPHLLLVDDAPLNLDLLKRILRMDKYETTLASNGTEALAVCGGTHIDLILMDVMMPDIDGFQVCIELKANPATRDIPIIFLSALDDTQSRQRGLALGAVDYIGKPFDAAEIRECVRGHLNAYLRQRGVQAFDPSAEIRS